MDVSVERFSDALLFFIFRLQLVGTKDKEYMTLYELES